jgi:hypothetical protein
VCGLRCMLALVIHDGMTFFIFFIYEFQRRRKEDRRFPDFVNEKIIIIILILNQ